MPSSPLEDSGLDNIDGVTGTSALTITPGNSYWLTCASFNVTGTWDIN